MTPLAQRHYERLKSRDPARLAARLLLNRLDYECGPRPVWKPEMELLRAALAHTQPSRKDA